MSVREGRAVPVRTCVGCRRGGPKRGLVRLVRAPDGSVLLDPTGRAPGRGAYIHPDPVCVEVARKRRALERALAASVPDGLWAQLPATRQ